MPAVLEAEETATSTAENRIPPQLAPYLFKAGNKPKARADGGIGRPKGAKSAETIYLESLPIKARQWVRSTAPGVLIDARKIALPIESDVVGAAPVTLIGFLEGKLLSSVAVPVAEMGHTTVSPLPSTPDCLPLSATEGNCSQGQTLGVPATVAATVDHPPTPPPGP